MIKFYNILNQDKFLHKSIIKTFKRDIKKTNFILGEQVKSFEEDFSKFTNNKFSVGCANGTDAIYLALKALNLPSNSEVIVPAMTWISTALSVVNCGLKPVLADIDENSPLLSINEIIKKVTPKTKAVIPVHLYGSVFNTKELKKRISKNIFIIEDAAQAHGGRYDDNFKIGKYSNMACYSFYPGKNLGCYGDGGLITTNSTNISKNLIKLRNMGSSSKFKFDLVGINSRLDEVQASILKIKLKKLNFLNAKRIELAKIYHKLIQNNKISKLNYSKYAVFHQYVVQVKNRSKFIKLLKKNDIGYGLHFPVTINKINSFKKFFKNDNYKFSEKLSKSCISLPIDPSLKRDSIKKICNIINKY